MEHIRDEIRKSLTDGVREWYEQTYDGYVTTLKCAGYDNNIWDNFRSALGDPGELRFVIDMDTVVVSIRINTSHRNVILNITDGTGTELKSYQEPHATDSFGDWVERCIRRGFMAINTLNARLPQPSVPSKVKE